MITGTMDIGRKLDGLDRLPDGGFNPAAAGPPRHPPAAGGGIKLPPLYFSDDIVATRSDREAKLCTYLPGYLAEVEFKFGVDLI